MHDVGVRVHTGCYAAFLRAGQPKQTHEGASLVLAQPGSIPTHIALGAGTL